MITRMGHRGPWSPNDSRHRKGAPVGGSDLVLLQCETCPDCRWRGLVPGPRGGIMRNWACGHCGAEFNVGMLGGEAVMAHRNSTKGKPDRARLRDTFGIELEEGA